MYRARHVFRGDDYCGKFDGATLTVFLSDMTLEQECRGFLRSVHGIGLASVKPLSKPAGNKDDSNPEPRKPGRPKKS